MIVFATGILGGVAMSCDTHTCHGDHSPPHTESNQDADAPAPGESCDHCLNCHPVMALCHDAPPVLMGTLTSRAALPHSPALLQVVIDAPAEPPRL